MRIKGPNWKRNRKTTHCCGRPRSVKTVRGRLCLVCEQCGNGFVLNKNMITERMAALDAQIAEVDAQLSTIAPGVGNHLDQAQEAQQPVEAATA